MPRYDPKQQSRNGAIGAAITRSRHDPRDTTSAGRAAFLRSFLDAVDPEGQLPEAEREARATALRRAHFLRLASASARVRARNKGPATLGDGVAIGGEDGDAARAL